MNVGQNIKRIREACGMTQAELARRAQTSQAMICQIERGTKRPSLPLSAQIADVLRCDVHEFLAS